MYRDTVTLFNRYKSKLGDTWYPSVLHGVDFNLDKSAIIAKYGSESKDNAILHVKYIIRDKKKLVGNKIWMPPKEWCRQTDNTLKTSLTFTDGNKFDFFFAGEWENEEPISDDSYGIDGFYDYMNRNHDYVFAITSICGPYNLIPHFEIIGA